MSCSVWRWLSVYSGPAVLSQTKPAIVNTKISVNKSVLLTNNLVIFPLFLMGYKDCDKLGLQQHNTRFLKSVYKKNGLD